MQFFANVSECLKLLLIFKYSLFGLFKSVRHRLALTEFSYYVHINSNICGILMMIFKNVFYYSATIVGEINGRK